MYSNRTFIWGQGGLPNVLILGSGGSSIISSTLASVNCLVFIVIPRSKSLDGLTIVFILESDYMISRSLLSLALLRPDLVDSLRFYDSVEICRLNEGSSVFELRETGVPTLLIDF